MKTLHISQDLQEKMHRRASRAFANFDASKDERITRCSDVTRTSLRYRISHEIAGTSGYYSGPKVLIQRVIRSRWYNPLSWGSKPEIIIPKMISDDDSFIAHVIGHQPDNIDLPGDGHKTITMLPAGSSDEGMQ